jgi:hypothetical protein
MLSKSDNATKQADGGIFTKDTWWQTNCMTANIEAAIREHKNSMKSIILNMSTANVANSVQAIKDLWADTCYRTFATSQQADA